MFSSDINTNIISNSTGITNAQYIPTLPAVLAPPTGWRSEIVHANSSGIVTNNTNNNYGRYNLTNSYDNLQTPPILSAGYGEYNNTSIDNYSLHQQRALLTQQQQRNIVRTVESQYPPPLLVRKTLPDNQVTYQQNVSVRYLQPPTPPPPGPLIIREVRPPPPPPQPPIKIRQRPGPPPSPPPIVLRERPPFPPPHTPAKVIEKLLPPQAPAPPSVIVERYGADPPKPSDVIIERWLPYKEPGPRKVLVERAPEYDRPQRESNLLVLYDSPRARIDKHFIDKGVVRADPDDYLRRYGAELDPWYPRTQYAHLVGEATRAVPPRSISPYISNEWGRTRVGSPIPRSSSYDYGYSYYNPRDYYYNQSSSRYRYDRPYDYCGEPSYRYGYDIPSHYYNRSYSGYGYDSSRYYDDYPVYYDSYRPRTPSWDRYYRSSSYSPYYRSSSYYHPDTIHVNSDREFRRVICDLTDGRVPPTVGSY